MFDLAEFIKWRGDKAASEKACGDRAANMAAFVSQKKSLDALLVDLKTQDSTGYTQFTGKWGGRIFSIMAFVKLSTQVAIEKNIFPAEINEECLKTIESTMADLYVNYTGGVNAKFDNIFTQLEKLVNIDLNTDSNTVLSDARSYCFSLYFALRNIQIYINKPDAAKTTYLERENIDINLLNPRIETLLLNLIKFINALELKLLLLNKVEARGLREELEQQFLLQIAAQVTITDKLDCLTKVLETTRGHLDSFLDAKASFDSLTKNHDKLKELLKAVDDNDQAISGRKYLKDLIAANRENYDLLIKLTPDSNEEFLHHLEQIENPNTYDSIVASTLQGVSGGTKWFTNAYRKYTSPAVQAAVSIFLPETADSQAKCLLKKLINSKIESLSLDLVEANRVYEEHLNQFAKQPSMQKFVKNQSLDNLKLLATELKQISAMTHTIGDLAGTMVSADQAEKNAAILQAFIDDNDGFFNKIWTFLAQYFSIFLTQTVMDVVQAKQLKGQYAELAATLNTEAVAKKSVIQNDVQAFTVREPLTYCLDRTSFGAFSQQLKTPTVRELLDNRNTLFSPKLTTSVDGDAASNTFGSQLS